MAEKIDQILSSYVADQSLTPSRTVAELDRHIIGQAEAKRAVAVALRNRWRRLKLPDEVARDVGPKNILMIGPTGVGKTEIARRLAGLVKAPFIKVEATKYTEVGYHGRDVDVMIRDLLEMAIRMVRDEFADQIAEPVDRQTEERLLDCLLPRPRTGESEEASRERAERTRGKLRDQLRAGALEDSLIDVSVEEKAVPLGMFTPMGLDQLDAEFQGMFDKLLPTRTRAQKLPVRDARKIIRAQQLEAMLDREKITTLAIQRTENTGIVFIDEIDKVCGPESKHGPDVSRQGVQRDLLPIVEGTTVTTRHGMVRTDHILFIGAGAFTRSKPSDLMPELQGRFPIRVELGDLSRDDFVRILTEPQNALIRQQAALLAAENVEVTFRPDAITAMAEIAFKVNQTVQNIGARRLYTIVEKVMEDLSFSAPERAGEKVEIDEAYVRERLADIARDEDLSKFIL
ncbi:MAG: ATP-dependent protease ATPase subunit HslU [Phycisphaerae bacterium]|nr:ATP-dependent protease ATPase subunit HslU [Phycisphaerae bacterium]